jgi:flagellar hook-associated protein 1
MSDLLTIGASGIKAYARALSTVGDNIANAQTPGFARRSVRLEEAQAAGDVVLYRNNIRPGGVTVAGVDRAVDAWLVEDARVAGSDSGRTAARLNWVSAAERAMDDGAGGVGANITAVFNTADRLASDPGNAALRSGFLNAVGETASAFRRTADGLQSAASGIASQAQTTVTQVNTDLASLERVNAGLRRARAGSTNEATLLDERDRLIDQVSGSIAVTTTFDARGAVTLRDAGPSGEVLVGGGSVATLSLSVAANGQLNFGLTTGSSGTITPISGALAGLAEAATQIAGQRTQLDTLSNQFSNDLNTAHQSGLDTNGTAGVALLIAGNGAATITAASLTPGDVAAADASSANGNILGLASLRGPGGAESGWAALVSSQAQATAAARAQNAAATTRREGAFAARDDVSEVDLDHEAAELLRFQQAYEGAARVIQVARETMQSILSVF